MNWILFNRQVAVFLCATAAYFNLPSAAAQHDNNHTEAITPLIKRWNEAHNTRRFKAFEHVYDKRVVMHAQQMSRAQCIQEKQKFLQAHPDYQQRTNELNCTTSRGGVIKCDFKKEVRKDGVLWKYPAYLLISATPDGHVVVGESDDATDRTLTIFLKSKRVEPLAAAETAADLKTSLEPLDTLEKTAVRKAEDSSRSAVVKKDGVQTEKKSEPIIMPKQDSVSSANTPVALFTDDIITIPAKYVYMLIGLLVLGSLLILSAGGKSKKNSKKSLKQLRKSQGSVHDYHDRDEEQSMLFEKFVAMLFDPLYFRAFRPAHKRHAGSPTENFSELGYEFNHKQIRARFLVETMYIQALRHRYIRLASPQRIQAYRQLDEDDADLYLVLGIEGKPDDPKEIYLIPLKAITKPLVTYPELQPYRKYGMFFYSAESKRLQ